MILFNRCTHQKILCSQNDRNYLNNSSIFIVWIVLLIGLCGAQKSEACEFRPFWETEGSRKLLIEMYDLADRDTLLGEKEAGEARKIFRKILRYPHYMNIPDYRKFWFVSSTDKYDGIQLFHPQLPRFIEEATPSEERCFTQYHDKYEKMSQIIETLPINTPEIPNTLLNIASNLIKLYPNYTRGYVWAAVAEMMLGNKEHALKHLTDAKGINSMNPVVPAAMSLYHYADDNIKLAKEYSKRARELQPSLAFALSEAIDYLQKAVGVKFEDVEPKMHDGSDRYVSVNPVIFKISASDPSYLDGKTFSLLNLEALCLDVAGAGTASGTNIRLYHCNKSDAQKWSFSFARELRSQVSPNACLGTAGGNITSGADIQLYPCDRTEAQHWIQTAVGEIRNAQNPNFCLDIKSGNIASGTNIQLYHCNKSDAQKWKSLTYFQ